MESTRRRVHVRRPLTPEKQQLAERYVPMARSLARRLKDAWPTAWDEFESAAMMALVEAAESFDPLRNVKFATFARFRIQGALRDVQRRMALSGWRTDDCHAESPHLASLSEETEAQGRPILGPSAVPVERDLDALDAVEGLLRQLPEKHAAACRAIYVDGCTQAEAARQLGCSQSRLSYIHREALDMLNGAWYQRLSQTPAQVN